MCRCRNARVNDLPKTHAQESQLKEQTVAHAAHTNEDLVILQSTVKGFRQGSE